MTAASSRETALGDLGYLRSARAVRERCHNVLAAGDRGDLSFFEVNRDELTSAARLVAEVTREAYPTLAVPYHCRANHLRVGGVDRVAQLRKTSAADPNAPDALEAEVALILISVLLDAGAGPDWAYVDAGGQRYARSEGLAVASFDMFMAGLFGAEADGPFRVTARGLRCLDAEALARGFQVSASNPIVGLEGRLALLRSLAGVLESDPDAFGPDGDLGTLAQVFLRLSPRTGPGMLRVVLERLGGIWPPRLSLHGVSLGDVARHPAAGGDGETTGLVPFHKLSQWLTYSLIPPLEASGHSVGDVDGLTGLAEYRNGGLFIDAGVLRLVNPADLDRAHDPAGPLVSEWRALTVALLDEIAPLVREQLGVSATDFPLARVLEGGTWAAGRRLAQTRGGAPPLKLKSDGTLF